MGASFDPDGIETRRLLERAAAGDAEGWQQLVARYGRRLRAMISLRMDTRLQGRVDPSDVLQDAYLEASEQLVEYVRNPPLPVYLWLRGLAATRLAKLHRYHLGTQLRDAGREVSLYRGAMPEASSAALAARLLGKECRPSEIAVRAEIKLRLQEALNRMEPLDREVLALRHFEQLTNAETARVLELTEQTASKRYVRALKKLKAVLAAYPGGVGEWY
jgi:RNA polymerase sigma-70 factor (ECF subfamily)